MGRQQQAHIPVRTIHYLPPKVFVHQLQEALIIGVVSVQRLGNPDRSFLVDLLGLYIHSQDS